MKYCSQCGKDISSEWQTNSQNKCTSCLGILTNQVSSIEPVTGKFPCYVCGNPANLYCSVCRKPICDSHIKYNSYSHSQSDIRCNLCKAEKSKRLNIIAGLIIVPSIIIVYLSFMGWVISL
ncbi:MAG: hypothetical protein GY870_11230 [archaeon]|nr:hypothetical protein [archaeon]